MLVELRIRNVAVIDTVALPLAAGLNVLTGETGAGTVEGVFEPGAMPALRSMLDERGIEADEETLVLKREIGSNGRSRAWINGSPVTAAVLAEVGARLVSVLGQHDSRQLVDAEHQRDVLDAFTGALDLRARVADAEWYCAADARKDPFPLRPTPT